MCQEKGELKAAVSSRNGELEKREGEDSVDEINEVLENLIVQKNLEKKMERHGLK